MMKTALFIGCLPLLAGTLLTAESLQAAELYRYVDDNGVVVISRHGVPPEDVAKGYEVLNEQGRVIREVAPAPSVEEWQRQQQAKAQQEQDRQLLKLYSNVQELDAARDRKLAELEGLISVSRANLSSSRQQLQKLQAQAAQQEREGHSVAAALLDQMQLLKRDQAKLEADIERYQQQKQNASDLFAQERARLQTLLSMMAPR